MAKFSYEKDGHEYEIEADDEKSADAKFTDALKSFNLSEKEKEASKNQAKYKEYDTKYQEAKTPLESLNAGLNSVFGRINREVMNKIPGAGPEGVTQGFVSPSLTKGIPAAGRFVEQTPYLSEMEKQYPKTAKGLNITGGVASTLPGAAAMSVKSGAGFLPQFMGQGTYNTGLNIADKMAEQRKVNISPEDTASAAKWGFATGALPAAFTRLAGQSARVTQGDELGMQRHIAQMLRAGVPRANVEAMVAATPREGPRVLTGAMHGPMEGMGPRGQQALSGVASAGLGGAAGHFLGGHGMEGAVLGAILSPHAHTAAENIMPHIGRFAQHPSTQDVLRALMSQSQPMMTPTENP